MKQLFWITFAVVLAALPQAYRLPIWFLPMTLVVIGYRFYAQIHEIRKAYNLIMVAVALLALLLVVYSQGIGITREISVTILITMTVLKLLETYTMRDAQLVVMLCYFVTMTRFLYSQDLLLIFYLLGSAFVTTHALSVLNHAKNAQWFDKTQIKQTTGSLALAIPFAVLFFLVFPRLGSPIWGSPDIFGEGKTGISDTMSPGSIIELFLDDSPAFRVTFSDVIKPPNNQLYWRGPVLWNFDGRTWSRKKHNSFRSTIKQHNTVSQIKYQIELESTGQNYMFGLDYIKAAPTGTYLLPDSLLYSPTKINQLRHYELESVLVDRFYSRLSNQDKVLLLDYPSNQNLRTLAMMNDWVNQTNDPLLIIEKTLNWFKQDEFFYSYTPPPLDGEVIDQFLFESKRGFCEHYASSFTIMMRMAGIPARVVTGYQGGVDNGDYLLVKQSDAHAWSEVFIQQDEQQGYWLRVDPTSMVSPERVERGSREIMNTKRSLTDFEWLINWKESMDKYRYQWNQWVRDFNVSKQEALFKIIGIDHREGKTLALLLAGILIISAILVLIPLWIINRKKYTQLQSIYLKLAHLVKSDPELYSKHKLGIELFTKELTLTHPQAKNHIKQFLDLYLKARYSRQTMNSESIKAHLFKVLLKIKASIAEKQTK